MSRSLLFRYSRRQIHSGFVPTISELERLRKDKKKIESSLSSDNIISINYSDDDLNFSKTSRLSSYRMAKASDYVWALKQNLIASSNFVESNFKRLEDPIYSVNDTNDLNLVSIDLTMNGNLIKEIGVSIFDSEDNLNASLPNIINKHIIIKEFHGVLSTNNFHGESDILSLKEAQTYLNSTIDKYFNSNKSSKLVGFKINELVDSLQKFIKLQSNLNSIDIQEVYSIPFTFNKTLSNQSVLKSSNFLQLETILKRLNLPHSFLINCGNSSYYQLIALLSLTNPYHRIKFKLDNILGNFDFMEKFLIQQLNKVLKQSEINQKSNSKLTINTYETWQKADRLPFKDHKSALLKAFQDQ